MLWADNKIGGCSEGLDAFRFFLNKMPRRIRQRSELKEGSRGQHSSTLSTTTVNGTVHSAYTLNPQVGGGQITFFPGSLSVIDNAFSRKYY